MTNCHSRTFSFVCSVAACLLLSLVSFGQANTSDARTFRSVQMLTSRSGWALAGNHLLWTANAGGAWQEITPVGYASWSVQGIFFHPDGAGWLLLGSPEADQPLQIARTTNAGKDWAIHSLTELSSDDAALYGGSAALFFLDGQQGWLVLKMTSSSNFSRGFLFKTEDGGGHWTALPEPPLGEPVLFADPLHGFMVGGPVGDSFYRTSDGGESWTPVSLPDSGLSADARMVRIHPPVFKNPADGALSVSYADQQQEYLLQFTTQDGGASWSKGQLLEGAGIGSKEIDPVKLAPQVGSANLPNDDPNLSYAVASNVPGFDMCSISTVERMQSWAYGGSPYRVTNLYIGGIARACANTALNASWVQQVAGGGWQFILTWVGPQAPGTTFRYKMSADPVLAQSQGIAEADAAASAAVALGFVTGTAIYYDLEAYTRTNTVNVAATQAFLNGWINELHAKGDLAGVYSSHPEFQDWEGGSTYLPNPPDAIWFARWGGNYHCDSCQNTSSSDIPDSLWANHQRIRQTSGSFDVTYGGITFNLDEDYLDGPVSVLPPGPFDVAEILRASSYLVRLGTPVNFSVKLLSGSTAVTGGGAVSFYDGGSRLGTAAVSDDGTATVTMTILSPGIHTVTANYSGTTRYASATATLKMRITE